MLKIAHHYGAPTPHPAQSWPSPSPPPDSDPLPATGLRPPRRERVVTSPQGSGRVPS
jgi:hypothetical protein